MHLAGRTSRPLADPAAATLFAWFRVVALVGVSGVAVATGYVARDELPRFLGVAAAALLGAIGVVLALRRRALLGVRIGSPVLDLAQVFALHVLVPELALLAVLFFVLIATCVAYVEGRRPGLAVAAVAVVLVAVGDALAEYAPTGVSLHGARPLAVGAVSAALVLLVERAGSRLRQAEARSARVQGKAETILANVASPVVVTDAEGHVIQWNAAAVRTLVPQLDEALRAPCRAALGLHVGDVPLDCSGGCPLLDLAQGSEAADVWRVLPDGRRQALLADAAAVRDAATGRVLEVVHSLRDVTRMKQADEAKSMFLATASHELKTPLTVIGGFAELLLSTPDLPEASRTDALEAIHRRAIELSAIVDRLLLSSRIEAGRVDVRLADVDVRPLLAERVASLEASTGRAVVLDAPHPLPLVVADPASFVTVVDHLLDNAVRYSPGGEAVTVGAEAGEHEVRVWVADRGIGMDDEQMASCFDRFWQAESTDVRRFGGTGIGLYIVRSLVDAMGGTVSVESSPGRGSVFTLGLATRAGVDLGRRPSATAPHAHVATGGAG